MLYRVSPAKPIKTEPVGRLLKEKKPSVRYDETLYLKTTHHLYPQRNLSHHEGNKNRTIESPESSPGGKSQKSPKLTRKAHSYARQPMAKSQFPLIPCAISIFKDPLRSQTYAIDMDLEELLLENTRILVSAKRWGIFENYTKQLVKGFKTKKYHEIASLTKIMTFYCCYVVIVKYYLVAEKFYMLVDRYAYKIGGTRAHLVRYYLISLMDLLYGMMLNSGNDAAQCITKNLGALIYKKNRGEYFSPYDIQIKNLKEYYMRLFICLMNSAAKYLNLTQTRFFNAHGLVENTSTVRDLATITYECLKIPLFQKIIQTKTYTAKCRFVNSIGVVETKYLHFVNTNKLLSIYGYKGVKTGYSQNGGGCLISLYEDPISSTKILVIVLGCSGKDSKFNDTYKLVEWYKRHKKNYVEKDQKH